MFLSAIRLINYKNYTETSAVFKNKFTLINGLNGSGKTNFIDAIHYICLCKSYFSRYDVQVLKKGTDFFRVDADFFAGDEKTSITCKFTLQKKEFQKNAVAYDRLSEHIGKFPVVMIAPDDIGIINNGAEERRRFLDTAIAQINHHYLQQLLVFNKILSQRNILLKNYGTSGKLDTTLLQVLNEQLSAAGDFIFSERKKYLQSFLPVFSKMYHLFSGEKESGGIEYISPVSMKSHAELFIESIKEDMFAQRTTTGIHKDDIRLTLNGSLLRDTGSQGQIKSFLIALKLTQYQMMFNLSGAQPILLLDDVFEKLDKLRLEVLFSMLSTDEFSQIFITDADEQRSVEFCKHHVQIFDHFYVKDNLIQ